MRVKRGLIWLIRRSIAIYSILIISIIGANNRFLDGKVRVYIDDIYFSFGWII